MHGPVKRRDVGSKEMAAFATWASVFLFGVGAFVMALGFGYGSGPRIGSAVFPLLMSGGIVLTALWGLVAAATGREESGGRPDLRPFGAVAASVALFILTVDRLGIIPASVICMAVAYLGQVERGYLLFLGYATLFAAGVWLLFSVALGLPVAAFGEP